MDTEAIPIAYDEDASKKARNIYRLEKEIEAKKEIANEVRLKTKAWTLTSHQAYWDMRKEIKQLEEDLKNGNYAKKQPADTPEDNQVSLFSKRNLETLKHVLKFYRDTVLSKNSSSFEDVGIYNAVSNFINETESSMDFDDEKIDKMRTLIKEYISKKEQSLL